MRWRPMTGQGRSPGRKTRITPLLRLSRPGNAATDAAPGATRFVFACTNRDVDALNAELRQVRQDRGDLSGPGVRLETRHGSAEFAVGDRVQFTDKRARIYNGNAGTITGIDARTGELRARLDGGREVSWSAAEFSGSGTATPGRDGRGDIEFAAHRPPDT
jgi:ATP-dependent exoDNAse (exonuclease V) alpha subunit